MNDFEEKLEYRVSYYVPEKNFWHTVCILPNEPLAIGIVEHEQEKNEFRTYKIEERVVRYYEWVEIE